MTSASSSKNDSTLGSKSAVKEESLSLKESILILGKLRKSFQDLVLLGIKSDWSLALREITGYLSCSCVFVFVAGYTCGSWVHRLNERLTRILLRR